MENFDINSLDVKTLRLLIAIEEAGSVSLAADKRGMTQSTASYGLDKLRYAFSDPLFVRAGRGMLPTIRGQEIIAECRTILDKLDTLGQEIKFDPGTAKRDFVLAAAGYEIEIIVTPLVKLLRAEAPKVRLIVKALELGAAVPKLEQDWDIALMAAVVDSPLLRQRKLLEDHFVTYYDPKQRKAPNTLKDFTQAPHALALLGGQGNTAVDQELGKIGHKRNVALIVDQFQALAPLMQETDLITTLPIGLHKGLMHRFSHCPCPLDMDEISVSAVWHVVKDQDPGHKWLRSMIKKVTDGLK